jgi:hypothetical protein
MRALSRRLPLFTLLLLLLAQAALAQQVIRDYDFKNEQLKDATGKGPELKKQMGVIGDGKFTFAAGDGLELLKAGVTDHYTLEVSVKFEETSSWRKIFDFKNQNSDNGLYVYNGQLQFYPQEPGGEIQANTSYRIRLDRDKATKKVQGYINGVRAFDFIDANDEAVLQDEKLILFLDDVTTSSEISGGVITRLRIWDAPGGE